MSTLSTLATWAHSLRIEHAPPAIVERLRMQAASVLGAAAAAAPTQELAPLLAGARGMGAGALRVAPGAEGLGLAAALMAGPALSSAHGHDDWMLCGHTGHSAVWAAWLGAADRGLPWADALRAQLAANEILGRLGGLCLAGGQAGQSPLFLHAVGGSLVAGLLRGDDPDRLAMAMGLALAQAPRIDGSVFSTTGRHLGVGRAVLDGWRVSELVGAGVTGPFDVLDEGSDFLAAFAAGRPVRGWLTGLPADTADTGWLTWSLAIKGTPGPASVGPAVEALRIALKEASEARGAPLRPDDILRIDLDVGAVTSAIERLLGGPGRTDPQSLRQATQQALATLLLAGEVGASQSTAQWRAAHQDHLAPILGKIRVHHDWRLSMTTWNALRTHGLDSLLGEMGLGPLLAAAGRAGGLEAGLSLTELPLALAGERLQGLQADELPALLGKGISRLTDFAARRIERLLPGPLPRAGDAEPGAPSFDLAAQPLRELVLPIPCRVRVLLHGGHVHQATVEIPRGAPGRPLDETRALVRDKLMSGLLRAAPDGDHQGLVDGLLGAGNTHGARTGGLPGAGPAAILAR
jgi:2-methylcitrate dehydratase PrpD